MIANSVVLPAPFGPISAVMRPVSAVNEAWSTARSPPKRLETCSTRSSMSAMAVLRGLRRCSARLPKALTQVRHDAGDAARRKRDHHDQHAAVDDEIKPRRCTCRDLGQLAECLDHQCAKQRAEYRADAADD